MAQWIKRFPPKHKDRRQAGRVATCHHCTWAAETGNAQNKLSGQTSGISVLQVQRPCPRKYRRTTKKDTCYQIFALHMHVFHYHMHPHTSKHEYSHIYVQKGSNLQFFQLFMICIPSVLLYISEENLIVQWFSMSGNVIAVKSVYLTVVLLQSFLGEGCQGLCDLFFILLV